MPEPQHNIPVYHYRGTQLLKNMKSLGKQAADSDRWNSLFLPAKAADWPCVLFMRSGAGRDAKRFKNIL